jgi:hypothetical protein
MKTVYDPKKRVYRNVPTAVQPKKWEHVNSSEMIGRM